MHSARSYILSLGVYGSFLLNTESINVRFPIRKLSGFGVNSHGSILRFSKSALFQEDISYYETFRSLFNSVCDGSEEFAVVMCQRYQIKPLSPDYQFRDRCQHSPKSPSSTVQDNAEQMRQLWSTGSPNQFLQMSLYVGINPT